ncbi:MAG: hypothetical protein LBP51_04760 [Deferribacteraceae bacterium]|jgi:hypothetical protein|nr:hypothetical protein [Deferribacteraceae bacterium]
MPKKSIIGENPIWADAAICDRQTFRWTRRTLLEHLDLPLFFYDRGESKFFLITDFDSAARAAVQSAAAAPEEALTISLYSYGGVSLREWIELYRICRNIKVDFKRFYENHNGQFGSSEDIEKLATKNYPDEFISYLDEKGINHSTVSLALKLWDNNSDALLYAVQNRLTAQSFKQFVEKAIDGGYVFPKDRRVKEHIDLDDALQKVNNAANPLRIHNLDNFETERLNIAFEVESFDEFSAAVNRLNAITPLMKEFYDALKKL